SKTQTAPNDLTTDTPDMSPRRQAGAHREIGRQAPACPSRRVLPAPAGPSIGKMAPGRSRDGGIAIMRQRKPENCRQNRKCSNITPLAPARVGAGAPPGGGQSAKKSTPDGSGGAEVKAGRS